LAILLAGAIERWGTTEKFAMVVETAMLNETEIGEYCRKRGLYPEQLRAWRTSCEQANADRAVIQRPGDMRADKRRIQALEKAFFRYDPLIGFASPAHTETDLIPDGVILMGLCLRDRLHCEDIGCRANPVMT
jgi:hypothetical protein